MAKKFIVDTSDIVHPGYILGMELKERGLSQKKFAEQIAIQPSHLSEVIKGKRSFNERLAGKIEEALGIPSQHWMQLQISYDNKVREADLQNDAEWNANNTLIAFDEVYDMKSIYSYIGIVNERPSVRLRVCEEELKFGTPAGERRLVQGHFHRSEKTGLDTRMIATWAVLAKYEASRTPCPKGSFDRTKMDDLSRELRIIFNENLNTLNRVQWKLSEYGIKFCQVHKLPHASIDGYSFVTDGIPSIVITLRINRIDNIAFAVLHEVGHLKLHFDSNSKWNPNLATQDEEWLVTKEENEANDYAANALIPEEVWADAPSVEPNPYKIQLQYKRWAKQKGVNVWIALGRLSHETGMYKFKYDKTREIN